MRLAGRALERAVPLASRHERPEDDGVAHPAEGALQDPAFPLLPELVAAIGSERLRVGEVAGDQRAILGGEGGIVVQEGEHRLALAHEGPEGVHHRQAAGDGSCAPSEAWDCPNADCGCAASASYRDWPGHCGDGVCQRGGDIPEHGGNCPLDCPEPTLASETAGLSERIADLRAAGRLGAGIAKALRTKVGRVAWLAVRGETTGARGVLRGLRVQIEALSGIQVDPLDAVGLLELVDLIEVLLAGGG